MGKGQRDMKEKYNELFNALKERKLISLYYDRVMFYDEGAGEIQFWVLDANSDGNLILKNKGVMVFFNSWTFEEERRLLHVFLNEVEVATFKFPSEPRIATNHNHFYIEEFAVKMSEALQQALPQKGDWADCSVETVENGLKHNLGKLKKTTETEEFKKSCIDLANYAAMAYYLVGDWRK